MPTVATGFETRTHGFPFPNWFPPGSPVVVVPTPFGRLTVGDASAGLCGGMAFAALDLYLFNVPRPQEPTPPVFRYLCKRLLDSWHFPFGVMKYYDGQRRPSASKFLAGVKWLDGLTFKTIVEEWPKIRDALDAGMPAPLGLIHSSSFDPRKLAENHQVLAHGYSIEGDAVALHIYDPNHPDDETAELTFSLAAPDGGAVIRHGCEGGSVRGLFLTDYARPAEAPTFQV